MVKKSLKLVFISEPGADGRVRTVNRTFSRVNPEVSDANLKAIGTGLGTLFLEAPDEVRKIEESVL